MTKPWYESDILRVCAAGALGAVADWIVTGGSWRTLIASIILAVVAGLRFKTNTAISIKKAVPEGTTKAND